MVRQRHWVNRGGGGDCIFATTTVLDFVHAFVREEPRTAMHQTILGECRRMQAVLHAFVVMPHHIHLVVRMPQDRTPSQFMHQLKLRSSARVRPLLMPEELAAFSDQTGLNENRFWQRSFRAKVIGSPGMFSRTISYVHWNPVQAGYVESPEDYEWSSAQMWAAGLWSEEDGLRL
jgi:putative transposase